MNIKNAFLILGFLFSNIAFADSQSSSEVLPIASNVDSLPEGAVGVDPKTGAFLNAEGYKVVDQDQLSEFDHQSDSFVKDWREATPVTEYEDTEFGENMYNEASTPTKLEVLRLLSKDTPSLVVFMTAVSMGIDIENVLQAGVNYQPNKSRDLASSAVTILPLLSDSSKYVYSKYELDDLERDDENKPYSVQKVIDNFFEDRKVLRPYPDWFEGQYHFMASAAELDALRVSNNEARWYRSKSSQDISRRPIFISLYEANQKVLIDGHDRIEQALSENPNAHLPVVFIFNRLKERSFQDIGYPLTIKGIQSAYVEKQLMLTPTPEWQLGEYHVYADISELYEVISIPEEDDFEPEMWQKLVAEAERYSVNDTSFLMVILSGASSEADENHNNNGVSSQLNVIDGLQIAAWDDPRTEAAFPYTPPSDGPAVSLSNLVNNGLVFNRPDLIAALNALGVKKVPVAIYYLDSARVNPFTGSGKGLIQSAIGLQNPNGPFGGSGGITPPPPAPPVCASPPCTEQ